MYSYWSQARRSVTPCVWFFKCRIGMLERQRTSLSGLLRAISYSHLLLAQVPEGRRLSPKLTWRRTAAGSSDPGLLCQSGPLQSSVVADFCLSSHGGVPRAGLLCWVMGQLRSRQGNDFAKATQQTGDHPWAPGCLACHWAPHTLLSAEP